MVVNTILYDPDFLKDLRKLDAALQERAIKTEGLFRENPLHPSLRLHALKGALAGFWSLSVTLKIRILFLRQENGDILFLSIGSHDIYRSL